MRDIFTSDIISPLSLSRKRAPVLTNGSGLGAVSGVRLCISPPLLGLWEEKNGEDGCSLQPRPTLRGKRKPS